MRHDTVVRQLCGMDLMVTHWLDDMGKAGYGRETAVKYGIDDHS